MRAPASGVGASGPVRIPACTTIGVYALLVLAPEAAQPQLEDQPA